MNFSVIFIRLPALYASLLNADCFMSEKTMKLLLDGAMQY